MSGVRLTGNSEVLYGSKMPNVIINNITVDYDNGVEDVDSDARITVNLSVRFTKPPGMQYKTVVDLFRYRELKDLHLHVYLTYADYVYEDLTVNSFDIGEWLITGKNESSELYRERCYLEIPFGTLAKNYSGFTNEYESAVTIVSTFDEKGNEVIEISNITKEFFYDSYVDSASLSDREYPPPPYISIVQNLTLLAFVGPSSETILENRFNEGDDTLSSVIANKFFGDITYHKILEKGKTSNKFYQHYTLPDGSPYYGDVLQSINGKIYSTDDFSFNDIKIRTENVIKDYELTRTSDAILDNNIKGLEAIINSSTTRSAVLGEMANYRSVYPNKDSATLSGEFYNKFVVLFSELIQSVESQKQLTAQLYYDSLVTDKRFSLYRAPYRPPRLDGTYDGIRAGTAARGTPEGPSNAFIPKAWFHNSRHAVLQPPLDGSVSEAAFKALYGNIGSDIDMLALQEGISSQFGLDELKREIQNSFEEAGYSDILASEMAAREIDYIYASGNAGGSSTAATYSSTEQELLNPTLNGGDYLELKSGDIKVVSSGMFCFDYEKAVRTHSKISQVFNIKKLQIYFRLNVPYEEFYVDKVELSRKEYRLGDLSDFTANSEKYIEPMIVLRMATPTVVASSGVAPTSDAGYIDYPKPLSNEIYYLGGSAGEGGRATEFYLDRLRYFLPGIFLSPEEASSTQPDFHSYLEHFNFDLPTSDRSRRLDGMHSLDDYVDTGIGTFTSERTYDGYRLMAFRYSDIMDDDVAYYNTVVGSADRPDRIEGLEASNFRNDPTTHYKIKVTCKDLTQLTFQRLLNIVLPAYNDFIAYASEAAEICNFNNLNNTFNTFFIEKINEKYPEKPWVKAAYVANALSEILFDDVTISQEIFDTRVLEAIMKISPENGNLFQVQEFAREFNGIMQHFYPASGIEELMTGPGATDPTPYKQLTTLGSTSISTKTFYNEIPITSPISGDIMPSETIDTALIRPPPALPVIREFAGNTGITAEGYTSSEFASTSYSDTALEDAEFSFDYFGAGTAWRNIEPIHDRGHESGFTAFGGGEQGNLIEKAYEKIMWPLTVDDPRFHFYYSRYRDGRAVAPRHGGNLSEETDMLTRANVLDRLADPPRGTDFSYVVEQIENGMTGFNANMMQFFIGIICRSSTIDCELNGGGTQAKRRAANGNRPARREFRTLSQIYDLILLYYKEANRRFETGDTACYNPNYRLLRSAYVRDGNRAAFVGSEDGTHYGSYTSWYNCIEDINTRARNTLAMLAIIVRAEAQGQNILDVGTRWDHYYMSNSSRIAVQNYQDLLYSDGDTTADRINMSTNLGIHAMVHPEYPVGDINRIASEYDNLYPDSSHLDMRDTYNFSASSLRYQYWYFFMDE